MTYRDLGEMNEEKNEYCTPRVNLGNDFISPMQVRQVCGLDYGDEQRHILADSVFREDVLECLGTNGYAVLPAPPNNMSLLDIDRLWPGYLSIDRGLKCINKQADEKDKTSFGWLALKKDIIFESDGVKLGEQDKFLSASEKVPNITEMSWFIKIYFEAYGVSLLENIYARTSSLNQRNNIQYRSTSPIRDGLIDGHMCLGHFSGNRLQIFVCPDNIPLKGVGLSAKYIDTSS